VSADEVARALGLLLASGLITDPIQLEVARAELLGKRRTLDVRYLPNLPRTGPCARCGAEHLRYGPDGTPLCGQCSGGGS